MNQDSMVLLKQYLEARVKELEAEREEFTRRIVESYKEEDLARAKRMTTGADDVVGKLNEVRMALAFFK